MQGDEPISITWGYDDQQGLLPSEAQVDGRFLTIESTELDHAGRYFCTAMNPAGEDSDNAQLDVTPGTFFRICFDCVS